MNTNEPRKQESVGASRRKHCASGSCENCPFECEHEARYIIDADEKALQDALEHARQEGHKVVVDNAKSFRTIAIHGVVRND